MSHCSGPVSTLPGALHPVLPTDKCDEHPEVQAVHRVQGETDSMGAEYFYVCQACYDKYLADKEKLQGGSFEGTCTCGAVEPLFPVRSWDEGRSGPVYYRCRSCRRKWVQAEQADLDSEDDFIRRLF